MKTDHIFYRIFKDLPETFFELWEESPELVNKYRFDSVELKQIIRGWSQANCPLKLPN
jgi:predicted transposase YdaD